MEPYLRVLSEISWTENVRVIFSGQNRHSESQKVTFVSSDQSLLRFNPVLFFCSSFFFIPQNHNITKKSTTYKPTQVPLFPAWQTHNPHITGGRSSSPIYPNKQPGPFVFFMANTMGVLLPAKPKELMWHPIL